MFRLGDFTLSSGKKSTWRMDVPEYFTDEDWEWAAAQIAHQLRNTPFNNVIGVPTGGEKLAVALQKYVDPDANQTIVVDDVYTTGQSIGKVLRPRDIGYVVYVREPIKYEHHNNRVYGLWYSPEAVEDMMEGASRLKIYTGEDSIVNS